MHWLVARSQRPESQSEFERQATQSGGDTSTLHTPPVQAARSVAVALVQVLSARHVSIVHSLPSSQSLSMKHSAHRLGASVQT